MTPKYRKHYRLAAVLTLAASSPASACGWWGDGQSGTGPPAIVVGADGRPSESSGEAFWRNPRALTARADALRVASPSPTDLIDAARLYRVAALQGHAPAQNNLAYMYEKGIGLASDPAEAARWYRAAAEAGIDHAQHALGELLLEGKGVARDAAAGIAWMERAANQGHPDAAAHLASLFALGGEVRPDPYRAEVWALRAARLGDEEARELAATLAGRLSRADLARAQILASSWAPRSEYGQQR